MMAMPMMMAASRDTKKRKTVCSKDECVLVSVDQEMGKKEEEEEQVEQKTMRKEDEKKTKRVLYFVLFFLFVSLGLITHVLIFGSLPLLPALKCNDFLLTPSQVPEDIRALAEEKDSFPGLAIVMIAFSLDPSDEFYQFWAHLSVYTLRTVAKYKGDVFLVTNNPSFHRRTETFTDAIIIDVSSQSEVLLSNNSFHLNNQKSLPKNGLQAKYFKTQLMRLISPTEKERMKRYSFVMYVDSDILFRSPLVPFLYQNLVPLFHYDFLVLNNPFSLTRKGFPNSYSSALFLFRTGALNGKGGELLDQWHEMMGKYASKSPKDQTALYYAITDNNWEEEKRVFRLDYNRLIFVPHIYDFGRNETSSDVLASSNSPFLHLALSGWSRYEVSDVVNFLSSTLSIPSDLLLRFFIASDA